MSIQLKNITKTFGPFKAVDDVSLHFDSGELIALLGPSGSGKTTILRMIAGLESPDSGEIHFEGTDATAFKVRDRGIGFVFQHYALFRHMSVFENIAFGLRVKPKAIRPSEEAIQEKVHSLLKLVQLDWTADRFPHQLSGGQRQRIALARALAVEPKVLLLDEPFGALDAKVRAELRLWLRRFHDELNVTTIFVTHDQEEALEVADRIVVMNEGRVEQTGTPEDVYYRPENLFVFQFLGDINLFHCREDVGDTVQRFADPTHQDRFYVRPYQLEVTREERGPSSVRGVISHINPARSTVRIHLTDETGHSLQADISPDEFLRSRFEKGESVYVTLRNLNVADFSI